MPPRKLIAGASLYLIPAMFSGITMAQGLSSADLLKPLANDWPTYSGDYSGKRYSKLTQVNQSNVKNLTLAWTSRMTAGAGGGG
jgi:alcohol dehydrogenase (cytochrome c)